MAVIVEDGSIVVNATSYVSESELTAYCAARGYTLLGNSSQLLILAADYLESLEYVGTRTSKSQTMLWPRTAYIINVGYGNFTSYPLYPIIVDGYYVDIHEIPIRLKKAQLEAAMQLDKGNDLLAPQGQAVISEKVGPLEVQYKKESSSGVFIPKVNSLIAPLLRSGGINIIVGRH